MREEVAGIGVPDRKQPFRHTWRGTRRFSLSSQVAPGVLLIPLSGALLSPPVPSRILLLPLVPVPKLNAHLDKRTLALLEREP